MVIAGETKDYKIIYSIFLQVLCLLKTLIALLLYINEVQNVVE